MSLSKANFQVNIRTAHSGSIFPPQPDDPFSEPSSPGTWSWKLALCPGRNPSAEFPEISFQLPPTQPLSPLSSSPALSKPIVPRPAVFLSSLTMSLPTTKMYTPDTQLWADIPFQCSMQTSQTIIQSWEGPFSGNSDSLQVICLHFISRGVVATWVQTDR